MLKYHQKTFELLGFTPAVSDENLARISDFETNHNLTLPASLKEWYSLQDYQNTLQDMLNGILGHDPLLLEEGFELGDGKDYLCIIAETQGGWYISVHLNGSENPPVLIRQEAVGETWSDWMLHAHTFSDCLLAIAWDSLAIRETLKNLFGIDSESELKEFLLESEVLGPETFITNMGVMAPRFVRGLYKKKYKTGILDF